MAIGTKLPIDGVAVLRWYRHEHLTAYQKLPLGMMWHPRGTTAVVFAAA